MILTSVHWFKKYWAINTDHLSCPLHQGFIYPVHQVIHVTQLCIMLPSVGRSSALCFVSVFWHLDFWKVCIHLFTFIFKNQSAYSALHRVIIEKQDPHYHGTTLKAIHLFSANFSQNKFHVCWYYCTHCAHFLHFTFHYTEFQTSYVH